MKKICMLLMMLLLTGCMHRSSHMVFWIKNSRGEPLYLQVAGAEDTGNRKLAIIQHGLASDMSHPAVQAVKKAFLARGYVVITFDSRYSLGKSGGGVLRARLSTFEEDLRTVVNWAKGQSFYHEPFALAGHSLGGASVLVYAAGHPEQAGILIPITPVVSGQRWEDFCLSRLSFCRDWKKDGFYTYEDEQISYQTVETAKSYDALRLGDKLKAKVLLIAAEKDNVVNPGDVADLYEALQTSKRLAVVPESGHNFESLQNQLDLYQAVVDFVP